MRQIGIGRELLAWLSDDAVPLTRERLRRSSGANADNRRVVWARSAGSFESLPSPPWAERGRAELSRLGLRPPAPLALTATEERVAALAAVCRTNRQVAQALFISPKTVEANLARVYRKLGISSRAELGAAIARTPPPHPPS